MTRKGAVHATARLANDAELRLAHLGLYLEAVPLAQKSKTCRLQNYPCPVTRNESSDRVRI